MIEDIIKDPVIRFLIESSSLTRVQLDVLLVSKENRLRDAVKLVEKGSVSKGSFMRTLRQGQANIEAAVYTLFLMAYLGLLDGETAQQLGRTTSMMTKVKESVSEEERARLIEALHEFGVKVARRNVIL
jgi:hypothetical protein